MAKAFNIVAIGALLIFILFVTGIFFLGSRETFNELLGNLPESFLARAAGGIMIGILGCVLLAGANLLLDNADPLNKKARIFRIVWLTLLLSSITSLVGTSFFFYH